ncbi:bifunctional heptose 7-phosphate kinase/heptose 1-phosphate adenyltransferase [Caproiciproducens sp. R2]|uniref:bifunctional heptose 7-phosphate kinase/heptose 1-phosphate adenyltransferase n=1 Tax=Caproiciproducens sp. R2 TaxID=3435187 RepID=UPI004034BDF7
MDIDKMISVLKNVAQVKVVVFGDYALDKYLYIDPEHDEPSAETGETAYQVHRTSLSAGVGGTITNNLRTLGAQVVCIGLVGDDGQGYELLRCLRETGADVSHMVSCDVLCTCTYMKPMRRGTDGIYREMNRFDFRSFIQRPIEVQREMMRQLESVLDWADGVIITDQFYQRNMGSVTDWLREQLSKLAAERKDKIFYADSRSFANEYRNIIVKCNDIEFFAMTGGPKPDTGKLNAIVERGERLYRSGGIPLFVTCGKAGIVVFDRTAELVPAFKVDGEIDIVGAGDAANAGIFLGLALGLTAAEAALLACCVSSITIQQLGMTGTASMRQVTERLASRR